MCLVRTLLFLTVAASLSLPAEAAEVRRLLLAAGANNGGVDRELLRYAVTDAENFVDVMQEMGGLDPADAPAVRAIARVAAEDDYRLSSLILAVTKSTPFRMRSSQS